MSASVVTSDGSTDLLLAPLLAGDRRALAQAITLIESTRSDHRARADALLAAILPHSGKSVRLGITGVPFFIVDGRYGLSGAQPAEAIVEALRRARVPQAAD